MGDWVIQDQTYPGYDSFSTGSGLTMWSQVIGDVVSTSPLTSWNTGGSATPVSTYRMVEQGNMTAVQTRGHIHWWIVPTNSSGSWAGIFGQDWGAVIKFRIGVGLMDGIGWATQVASDYDLNTPWSANDEYVWERSVNLLNISQDEWSGSPAARTRLYGTIPVVAKYTRQLQPPEVMVLHTQFDQVSDASAWFQDQVTLSRLQMYWTPQLRTYAMTR